MRMRISESPVFEALEARRNVRKVPALTVFHKAPLRLVLSLALTAPIAFNSYMTTTYGLTFSVGKGVPKGDTLWGVIMACALAIFLVPLTGYLSDRFGRKPVFLIQVALTGIIAFPYFAILNTGSVPLLFLGSLLLIAPTNMALTGSQAPLPARAVRLGLPLLGRGHVPRADHGRPHLVHPDRRPRAGLAARRPAVGARRGLPVRQPAQLHRGVLPARDPRHHHDPGRRRHQRGSRRSRWTALWTTLDGDDETAPVVA